MVMMVRPPRWRRMEMVGMVSPEQGRPGLWMMTRRHESSISKSVVWLSVLMVLVPRVSPRLHPQARPPLLRRHHPHHLHPPPPRRTHHHHHPKQPLHPPPPRLGVPILLDRLIHHRHYPRWVSVRKFPPRLSTLSLPKIKLGKPRPSGLKGYKYKPSQPSRPSSPEGGVKGVQGVEGSQFEVML